VPQQAPRTLERHQELRRLLVGPEPVQGTDVRQRSALALVPLLLARELDEALLRECCPKLIHVFFLLMSTSLFTDYITSLVTVGSGTCLQVEYEAMAIPRKTRSWKCPTCKAKHETVNGRWLMWLRLKADKTLRDVATRAKVSHTYVSDIEQNKRKCTKPVRGVYSNIERKLQQEGVIGR